MDNNEYDKPPFAAPPPAFMQTGNQPPTINKQESFSDGNPFLGITPLENTQPFEEIPPFDEQQTMVPEQIIVPSSTEKQQYKILDMFWLLNPKYSNKQQPAQKEAQFVLLSYNINFGNLRISFFDLTQNSIVNNVVFLGNMKRTVSGTIYPMAALQIVSSVRLSMKCMEQLFQDTGAEWQHSRPVCQIQKNEQTIRLIITDQKIGAYFYDFTNVQKDAFLQTCQFAYTKGFELMGQNLLK